MASVPYFSMMSSGSMPLPLLLLIRSPLPSWMLAWMKPSVKGTSPRR